jgi:hypothetical protein
MDDETARELLDKTSFGEAQKREILKSNDKNTVYLGRALHHDRGSSN